MLKEFGEPKFGIAVIAAGHVMVGSIQYSHSPDGGADVAIYGARIIERWGTSKGLGELYSGPLPGTVLAETVPLVLVPAGQVIYLFPIPENEAWYR